MKHDILYKTLMQHLNEDTPLHQELCNQIAQNGTEGLNFWYDWRFEDNHYHVNVFDGAENGEDSICLLVYETEIDGTFVKTFCETVIASIHLDKSEWARRVASRTLRLLLTSLSDEIDKTYHQFIEKGMCYQFPAQTDNDDIEKNAEQIYYDCTFSTELHVDLGYLIAINQDGIEILTEEHERTIIDFSMISDLPSKLVLIEKLTESQN